MEQQYLSLLQGVLEYEKKNVGSMCVIFSVAMVVIITVMALRFKKEGRMDKIIICCTAFILFVSFGIALFATSKYRKALQSDMDDASFVTYTGEFFHDNYQRDSFYHTVTIHPKDHFETSLRYPDYGNQYHLHEGAELMPEGTLYGTVVYAKSSHVIVYWEVDNP